MPYYALKNCVLTSPESFYMLVNLVTVFVRSVRMGCNFAGLYDMTQHRHQTAKGYAKRGFNSASMQGPIGSIQNYYQSN